MAGFSRLRELRQFRRAGPGGRGGAGAPSGNCTLQGVESPFRGFLWQCQAIARGLVPVLLTDLRGVLAGWPQSCLSGLLVHLGWGTRLCAPELNCFILPLFKQALLLEESPQSPQKGPRTLLPSVLVYKGAYERLQPLTLNEMVSFGGEIIWLEFWWLEQVICFSLTNLFLPQYPTSSGPEDLALQNTAFVRVDPRP